MPKNAALFSKKTLDFILKASRQKKSDWILKNRSEYEQVLLKPLTQFAATLKQQLAPLATGYHFPQKGLARIKRSANKAEEYGSYYKNWVSYTAARPRTSRFEHNPNLFFLIQPTDPDGDTVLLAGGLYMPSSKQLRAIRDAIATDSSAFEELFQTREFKTSFPGGFSHERKAKRPPRGFDPNHPKQEWLKLQAFFVWKSYSMRDFGSAKFAQLVAKDCAQILRMNALLDQATQGKLYRLEQKTKTTDLPSRLTSRLAEIQAPRRKMDF